MTTPEPHRVTPYVPRASVALLAIGLVATFLDVLFAKGVFDVMVNENELVSWLLALGVAGAGALAAVAAGIAAADGKRSAARMALGVWAFIGLAMATTRCFKGVIENDGVNPTDVVLSLVMIGVYLVGITLYMHTRDVWSRDRGELSSARRQLRRARRRSATAESRYTRVQHRIADVDKARNRIGDELRSMHSSIDGMQRQLHAAARDRLVLRLADPTQSSLFRSELEGGEALPGRPAHGRGIEPNGQRDRYIDLDLPAPYVKENR